MTHLLRGHAPITDAGWQRIDDEARERLTPGLAARRLVDFLGPHGWEYSAVEPRPRRRPSTSRADGVEIATRRVQPLVELRVPFALDARGARAGDRGAADVDFDDLDRAAQRLVVAENAAVFHGWEEAGITGITEASPHDPLEHDGDSTPSRALVAVGGRAAHAQRRRRPVRARARAASAGPTSSRAPSRAATRSSATSARSSAARSSGRPGVERRGPAEHARRRLPLRRRPGPRRSATRRTTPRRRAVPRGVVQLPGRHAGGGRRRLYARRSPLDSTIG